MNRQYKMPDGDIILASASATRQQMLRQINLCFAVQPAYVDEEAVKAAGIAESIPSDEIVIELASLKAEQIALQAGGYILGCDQILTCEGQLFSKPQNHDHAKEQLASLAGKTHELRTAIVIYHRHQRIWHHLATSSLTMRSMTQRDLDDYCILYYDQLTDTPGSYQIENGGAHLFTSQDGTLYDILGLPLLPLLGFLRTRGLRLEDMPPHSDSEDQTL